MTIRRRLPQRRLERDLQVNCQTLGYRMLELSGTLPVLNPSFLPADQHMLARSNLARRKSPGSIQQFRFDCQLQSSMASSAIIVEIRIPCAYGGSRSEVLQSGLLQGGGDCGSGRGPAACGGAEDWLPPPPLLAPPPFAPHLIHHHPFDDEDVEGMTDDDESDEASPARSRAGPAARCIIASAPGPARQLPVAIVLSLCTGHIDARPHRLGRPAT